MFVTEIIAVACLDVRGVIRISLPSYPDALAGCPTGWLQRRAVC